VPIEILPFTPEDVGEALALWRRSEGIGLFGESPERLAACVRSQPLSLIAREDGLLIGAVLCTHDGRRGYLHHLAVAETHRRHGIGRRLVQGCISALGRIGIPRCHLFVHRGNAAALAFWSLSGWTERKDVVMMSRDLVPEG